MKKTPLSIWLCAVASEFVEGVADAFLVVSGGVSLSQTMPEALPTLTHTQLLSSILLGGAWYAASFIKKTPPPFGQSLPPSVDTPATTTSPL